MANPSFVTAAAAAVLLLAVHTIPNTVAFVIPTHPLSPHPSSSLQMCICIHCQHVTNCAAYHFVEEKHSQPHMHPNPTWEPRDGSPTMQVHIREGDVENVWEKFYAEHEEETRKAEEKYALENHGAKAPEGALMGETVYDMAGAATYEYDVVECDDFVEERDSWVKNMPEEIRRANPDFVPT